MDFRSMSDGELRRAHAMFLADPNSFANNPAYMHGLVAEHSRRFSQGNVEADLDAASMPIAPDPMAGQDLAMPYPPFNYGQYRTARQRARRGLGPEPMDSVETDAEVRARYDARYGEGSYDADAPGRAYRQGPNAPAWARPSGSPPTQQELPPGYSEFAAGMAEAETGKTRAERLADADAFDARVDRMAEDYNQATGMPQPSGLAANDGYRDWSGWQPGDALPGRPQMGPTALESARADQTASRLDAIEAKYGPEARAIAERGDAEGVTDYDAVKTPREKQKNAYRREQEWAARMQGAEQDAAGNFLSPARADIRAQDERQATSNKAFREKVAAAPKSGNMPSESERWANYRAQMMLAGSNPRKNMVNAWVAMGDEFTTPEQRSSLRYMLPGGERAAAVDANNAANAMRLINADMIGQGGLGDTRAQMMQQKARADAAAYADSQWAQKPYKARTTAARERLMRDIENRFGTGTGIVAAELEVNDTQAQQETGAQSTNPTRVGPPPNPINPSVPLAVPSRPPGV